MPGELVKYETSTCIRQSESSSPTRRTASPGSGPNAKLRTGRVHQPIFSSRSRSYKNCKCLLGVPKRLWKHTFAQGHAYLGPRTLGGFLATAHDMEPSSAVVMLCWLRMNRSQVASHVKHRVPHSLRGTERELGIGTVLGAKVYMACVLGVVSSSNSLTFCMWRPES